MNSLINAKNITFEKDGKKILDNVSINIMENDFVTIIGPNGAGKSTLIKVLMGIIKVDGAEINKKTDLRIGYVPQKFIPDPALPIKVMDFITLGKKKDADIKAVLEEVQIDFHDRFIHVLSGGELQKAILARALINSPDLLILDEPAQNLDISNQLRFYALLEKIYAKRKCSLLMISHDLHLVMAKSKQVICLYHHICCSGEPHVVTKDPAFMDLFGNDMANMMGYYHHEHDHRHSETESAQDHEFDDEDNVTSPTLCGTGGCGHAH